MNKYDNIMMETAYAWSKLSYCKRKRVGAVLALENRILATGYNGTISNHEYNICEETVDLDSNEKELEIIVCPKCEGRKKIQYSFGPYSDEEDCRTCKGYGKMKLLNKTNEFTVHAEQNIISFCARRGISTEETTLYVTTSPCKTCAKLIAQSGIKRVVYAEKYHSDGIDFLVKCGVKVDLLKIDGSIEGIK